jgi:hypothetical protein
VNDSTYLSSTTHCIQFGSQRVRIICQSARIHEVLREHLQHCIVHEVSDSEKTLDTQAYSDLSNDVLLTMIMNDAITSLIESCSDALVIHAAGVTLADRGIVLCGESGSGKSTLTAWLIREGFGYLTDEVIAVPIDDSDNPLHMIGLARSLVLKRGSAFVLDSRDQSRVTHFSDGIAAGTMWVPPESLAKNPVCPDALPHHVIFPRYEANAVFDVQPLTIGRTAFLLMQNLVNARNLPQRGLPAIARLAASVEAYRVVYSDVAVVAQWLQAQ